METNICDISFMARKQDLVFADLPKQDTAQTIVLLCLFRCLMRCYEIEKHAELCFLKNQQQYGICWGGITQLKSTVSLVLWRMHAPPDNTVISGAWHRCAMRAF